MHVLITGNMGYVGPVLVRHLRQRYPDARITGFDSGFFAHCLTHADALPEAKLDRQIFCDVRDLTPEDLWDVDAVVHLAAVSNDPMGNRFEAVTEAINQEASLRLAALAKAAGVKNFVFASSCSVYGFASDGRARKEEDQLNPLTAYARSKIGTEEGLRKMQNASMTITSLRFATACGMSPRLRLDLVVNDFVACAISSGEITVLSDGTPWRPLIDVNDMARAIDWAITRKADNGGAYLAVNAGSDEWNYQVADLAKAVAAAVPGTKVSINMAAPPDKRSYKVDFSLYRSLAPAHQPRVKLAESIMAICEGLRGMGFADRDFRNSQAIRLRVLENHMKFGRLGEDLRWDGQRQEQKLKIAV
jgi:nucleoside-diphosphate-sugar epimerase